MKRRCYCTRCGRTLRAPIEVKILFHDCADPWERRVRELRAPTKKRVVQLPPAGATTLDEARAEAWNTEAPQFAAFAAAVPVEALLRRVE